jgi:hypothetical protein
MVFFKNGNNTIPNNGRNLKMTAQKTAQTQMGSRFELFGSFLKIGSDPRLTWIVEDLLLEQYCEHLDTNEEIEIDSIYQWLLKSLHEDKRIEKILKSYLSTLKEVRKFYNRYGYHPTPFSPHFSFEERIFEEVSIICTDLISAAFPKDLKADRGSFN